MVFTDPGDFQQSQIENIYSRSALDMLPNVVCLLGKGVICYTSFDDALLARTGPGKIKLVTNPQLKKEEPGKTLKWALATDECEPVAYSWAILYGLLIEQLMGNVVMPPSPVAYMQRLAKAPRYHPIT